MDEDWKTLKFESFLTVLMTQIVYSDNFLYCLSFRGEVHSFDMNKQQWRLLPRRGNKSIIVPFNGGILLDTADGFFRLDVSKTNALRIIMRYNVEDLWLWANEERRNGDGRIPTTVAERVYASCFRDGEAGICCVWIQTPFQIKFKN